MKDINVILTSAGGLVSPGIIKTLKSVIEREISVIGTDTIYSEIPATFCDKFFTVPEGSSNEYIHKMLDICEKNDIVAIVPWTSEEFLNLSKNKKAFEKIGVKIVSSDYDVLDTAHDKGKFCDFLKKQNLPHPRFKIVNNWYEFEKGCYELGYPEKKIVAKPTGVRGGNRGLRIIKESNYSVKQLVLDKSPSIEITLNQMKSMFVYGEAFPEYILMEYLEGDEYSVDCLVDKGKMIVALPKKRLMFNPGMSVSAKMVDNKDVIEASERICEALKCSYNFNIQFKFSEGRIPIPFEANPRIGASVAFCSASNVNMVYYAIKLALNEKLPEIKPKFNISMHRYWSELYVDDDGKYTG